MNGKVTRRNAVKGATTIASAAALGVASKKSSVFAAPAFVRQTGSAVNVVYWGSWSAELGEAEQEVVRRFNESQSDVVVEYQFQGSYEETAQKLTAALAANQTPDLSALSDVWWFRFYLASALAPLNDLIAANEVDTSDYVDSLFQEGVRNDVSYWLPFARSTPLFYFNREAFAEAGLPDRGPETWAEFLEWVPDLVVEEGGTVTRHAFGHPNAASYVAWLFQPVVWQWGGAYSDPDFTIRLAEEQAVAAGEFYKSSTVDGWALPAT
ncbi:MAG: extracellular solute-binding protein, partial [Chloroflexota bacterium]|nr:extracellular solute-binding protein [Chloroflexota bacterium]